MFYHIYFILSTCPGADRKAVNIPLAVNQTRHKGSATHARYRYRYVMVRVGQYRGTSTAVLHRGTFLVSLSVPSILFKKCTVFDTVVTF